MSKAIQVRVTDEEHEIIEAKAKKLGLTLSAYIRIVALNSDLKIVSTTVEKENKK